MPQRNIQKIQKTGNEAYLIACPTRSYTLGMTIQILNCPLGKTGLNAFLLNLEGIMLC